MMMKRLRWSLIALVVLLTASECNGVHPVAAYRALLEPTSGGVAARGVASAILYNDRQLVVNGTYQDLAVTVGEVRVTFVGQPWCRLDHIATGTTQGTFSDTCALDDARVLALDGGNAWVDVFDAQFNPVLAGRIVKERTY
jgi:hypothetical protein